MGRGMTVSPLSGLNRGGCAVDINYDTASCKSVFGLLLLDELHAFADGGFVDGYQFVVALRKGFF